MQQFTVKQEMSNDTYAPPLTKSNQHITYESYVINSSQENEGKPYFFIKVILLTLTYYLINSMSIGVMLPSRPISKCNMKAL